MPFLPLGFVLLALVAYAPALSGWFLSDDALIGAIYPDGSHVDWGQVARTFVMDWRGFQGAEVTYYRPLVVVTLALDATFWGLDARGFHLTNVVLHGLVGFLVDVVGTRIQASRPAALLGGAAFVLHPLHPESVAWISGRTDLVYALPALASIAAFLEHRRTSARSMLALAGSCYALALLGKENAVVVPLIVFALDMTLPRRPPYRSPEVSTVAALGLYAALTLLYLWWRARVLGDVFSGRRADFFRAPEGNWTRISRDLTGNLELFLFPFNRQIGDQIALRVGAGLLLLALACALLVNLYRRSVPWRSVCAALVALFASIAPIATMMQIQENLNNTRMWYLPLAFLCLMVGTLCLCAVRLPGMAAGALLCGGWFVLLRANLGPWVDAGELIGDARAVYTQTFGAYAGRQIEGLPRIDRGAYVALYNAEIFAPPLVQAPPRLDKQARYRMTYDAASRRMHVVEDPAWGASGRLDRDLATGVFAWHPDGAPLGASVLRNLTPRELATGRFVFMSESDDPWLSLAATRDVAPPESSGMPEYAYLLIRPAPASRPELFWTETAGQPFATERVVALHPELMVMDSRIVQSQRDGFFVYCGRLDTHPRWPGLHAIAEVRLDPTTARGEVVIAYFNIARRGVTAH